MWPHGLHVASESDRHRLGVCEGFRASPEGPMTPSHTWPVLGRLKQVSHLEKEQTGLVGRWLHPILLEFGFHLWGAGGRRALGSQQQICFAKRILFWGRNSLGFETRPEGVLQITHVRSTGCSCPFEDRKHFWEFDFKWSYVFFFLCSAVSKRPSVLPCKVWSDFSFSVGVQLIYSVVLVSGVQQSN